LRKIMVRGDDFALAEFKAGDDDRLAELNDGAFDVDRDGREVPVHFLVNRLVVTTPDGSELLGEVSWHPVIYGPSYGCVAWNFGYSFLPRFRGKGLGTEVLRALVRYLFQTTDVDRIEGSTDVTNVRAQRSMEKAGFRKEGVLRGAQLRRGKRHDLVGYSILRSDPH
jgi:RimJ/RimL family protein N-acetyltransferase